MSTPDDSIAVFTEIFFYKQVSSDGNDGLLHGLLLPCPHPCPIVSLSDFLQVTSNFITLVTGGDFVCGEK